MSTTLERPPGPGTPTPPQKQPPTPRREISTRLAVGLSVMVVLLIAAQLGAMFIAEGVREDESAAAADAREANDGQAAAAQPATPPETRPEATVAVSLTEFAIELDTEEIPAWAAVTFEVTNNGVAPHDLSIDGGDKTPTLGRERGLLEDLFGNIGAVGAGGMGVVYRASDLSLTRTVALKTLPRLSDVAASRLMTEARTMAGLSYEDVAVGDGVGQGRGTPGGDDEGDDADALPGAGASDPIVAEVHEDTFERTYDEGTPAAAGARDYVLVVAAQAARTARATFARGACPVSLAIVT